MPDPESASVSRGDAAGVIHDIGYRHYDGPRLGPGAVAFALFVEGLRGAYGLGRSARSKVVPMVLLALMCVPALIWGLVTTIIGLDHLPVGYLEYILLGQVLVAMFLAAQAPMLVSRDIRHGVVTLYFSGPIGRRHYALARAASLAAATFVLMAVPLTLLLVAALLAELPLDEQLPEYLRALVAAALDAVLLAGIALVIAAWIVRRGLGTAAIVTVLLAASAVQAFVIAVAADIGAERLETWSVVLSPIALVDAIAGHLLRGQAEQLERDPSWAIGAGLAAVWLALVLACWGALMLRYRKVGVA